MSDREARHEQLVLYLVLAVVGLIPLAYTIAQNRVFGTESTIGLGMLVLASGGLFTTWAARPAGASDSRNPARFARSRSTDQA